MKVQKKIRLRVKEFFYHPCHPLCFRSIFLAGKFPVQVLTICRIQLFYPRKKTFGIDQRQQNSLLPDPGITDDAEIKFKVVLCCL